MVLTWYSEYEFGSNERSSLLIVERGLRGIESAVTGLSKETDESLPRVISQPRDKPIHTEFIEFASGDQSSMSFGIVKRGKTFPRR